MLHATHQRLDGIHPLSLLHAHNYFYDIGRDATFCTRHSLAPLASPPPPAPPQWPPTTRIRATCARGRQTTLQHAHSAGPENNLLPDRQRVLARTNWAGTSCVGGGESGTLLQRVERADWIRENLDLIPAQIPWLRDRFFSGAGKSSNPGLVGLGDWIGHRYMCHICAPREGCVREGLGGG